MKIKTSELTGAALDWAVAHVQRKFNQGPSKYFRLIDGEIHLRYCGAVLNEAYSPSTNWVQGGPIIEREDLCIGRKYQCDLAYCPLNDPAIDFWARTTAGGYLSYGPTHLIAAMRCYVLSKLGGEVEIPKELL
jgi:hypothetical protein